MRAISELMLDKISKTEFLKLNGVTHIDEATKCGLEAAYEKRDAEKVEDFIYLIFKFEILNDKYVDILNNLLVSKWHYKHEDIVILLQKISSEKSIKYLYDAIELHPEYLEWDDNYAFEVKCVRAIYHIGMEKSYSYLEELCIHPNAVIRDMAQRQLKKLQ